MCRRHSRRRRRPRSCHLSLIEKYWGNWKQGNYKAEIPKEPAPNGPIYEHVNWNSPTLPWVTVAFHGPAFSETEKDMPTMDVIQSYAFSSSSPLYQKLVVKEQKVDQFFPYFPDRVDPYLLTVAARVKDSQDAQYVRDEILKTFAQLRHQNISSKRLEEIKGNLKYSFANGMDNSESIAGAIVGYVARTRDPETVNRVYRLYDSITPADIKSMANKYFTDNRLVVVTLSHDPLAEGASQSGSVNTFAEAANNSIPKIESVLNRGSSPIINFRILFNIGAAHDPQGQEGIANLTAAMIANGGSAKK